MKNHHHINLIFLLLISYSITFIPIGSRAQNLMIKDLALELDTRHYTDSIYLKEIDKESLFKDFPWLDDLINDRLDVLSQKSDLYTDDRYLEIQMVYYKRIKRYHISIKSGVRGPRGNLLYYSPAEHKRYNYFKQDNKIILFCNTFADSVLNFKHYKETGDSTIVGIEPPMPDDRAQWLYIYDEGDEAPIPISCREH